MIIEASKFRGDVSLNIYGTPEWAVCVDLFCILVLANIFTLSKSKNESNWCYSQTNLVSRKSIFVEFIILVLIALALE